MITETVSPILISPASIMTIAQLVLSLGILIYLVKLKDKSRATRMLMLTFSGLTLFTVTSFLYNSLPYTRALWTSPLNYVIPSVALVFIIQFAYAFPRPLDAYRKESRVVFILTAAAAGAAVLFYVYYLYNAHSQSLENLPFFFYISLLNALELLVLIVIFLRRTIRFDAGSSHRGSLLSLIKPVIREARACRAFALMTGVLIPTTIIVLMAAGGQVPLRYIDFIVNIGMMLYYFGFTLVYLNFSPKQGSFLVKLVGASLVMAMGSLAALGYLDFPYWDKIYNHPAMIREPATLDFTPHKHDPGFDVRTAPNRFDTGFAAGEKLQWKGNANTTLPLNFPFPFAGERWDKLYISDTGVVTFRAPLHHLAFWANRQAGISPSWLRTRMDSQSSIFYQLQPGKATITWSRLLEMKTGNHRTLQLVLYKDGSVRFNYRDLTGCRPRMSGLFKGDGYGSADMIRFSRDLPYSSSSPTVVENLSLHYRDYIHQRMFPLALVVILAALTLLTLFPLFFKNNLLVPLRDLLEGFKRVEQGALDTPVPVRYPDETGSLTGSFNHMMHSIQAAKDGWMEADRAKEKLLGLNRAVLDTAAEGILTLNAEGRIISVNKAAIQMFHAKLHKIIGKSGHLLLDQKNWNRPKGFLDHFMIEEKTGHTGKKKRFGLDRKVMGKRLDGFLFPLEFAVSVTETVEGKIYTVMLRDMTPHLELEKEKQILEDQLRQSQKMETIGTLAGGVAHDFNNILTPIMGYAEMTLDLMPQESQIREWVQNIIYSCDRARELVRQILIFSQKGETDFQLVDMAELVKNGMKTAGYTIPSGISLHLDIRAGATTVFGDPTQLEQVLINLCSNAGHAMMPRGGNLYVDLHTVPVEDDLASLHPDLNVEFYVMLRVRDTGKGIEGEEIDHIFEPFFTTKPVGQGTGLGLSVTHGIVEKHNGAITVTSTPGKGSTFTVYFPFIPAGEMEKEIKSIEKRTAAGS
ncbi:MAG: HAMP domain-containing protein [bacterium]|nr:HAMP domain-containing protein [bacterium]